MSFHMLQVIPHVVGLVVLCSEVPIHMLSMHQTYSIFDLYKEFLVEVHTAKKDVCGVVFTLPVGWSRLPSAVNNPTATNLKNLECRHVWGFVQRRQTTSPPVLSCRFARKLICGLSFNLSWAPPGIIPLPPAGRRTRWLVPPLIFPEWHWSELCSPDSWCRRYNVVNA